MGLKDCRLVSLPKIEDRRGNLSFIEGCMHIPFDIKRVYYLYDVPGGSERGQHAHIRLQQLVIAISGSFDIELYDGLDSKTFTLNKADSGLFIDSMIWRDIRNFSTGAVCLVLASTAYDEEDYIRDISEFMAKVERGGVR